MQHQTSNEVADWIQERTGCVIRGPAVRAWARRNNHKTNISVPAPPSAEVAQPDVEAKLERFARVTQQRETENPSRQVTRLEDIVDEAISIAKNARNQPTLRAKALEIAALATIHAHEMSIDIVELEQKQEG